MTRVDLDAIEAGADYALNQSTGKAREGRLATIATYNVPALVAELRAAREVVDALHAWESMDGMYFGHTPQEGGNVGRALIAYDQVVGS